MVRFIIFDAEILDVEEEEDGVRTDNLLGRGGVTT
jgi:hypothetical protein